MRIKNLENIRKQDSYLYYRNNYMADAVFEYGKDAKEEKVPVEITIEKTAIGESKINVIINGHINYPMLQAIKMLKTQVLKMESEGAFG